MILKPIDIIVTSGVSVVIVIPEIVLKKNEVNTLSFCLTEAELAKYRRIIGVEFVSIKNGVSGNAYVLENNAGDIFYADRLLLGYTYRIRFGNNGPVNEGGAGGLGHFINLNTPCCAKGIDPANIVTPIGLQAVPMNDTAKKKEA